jgi:hypothetical protein
MFPIDDIIDYFVKLKEEITEFNNKMTDEYLLPRPVIPCIPITCFFNLSMIKEALTDFITKFIIIRREFKDFYPKELIEEIKIFFEKNVFQAMETSEEVFQIIMEIMNVISTMTKEIAKILNLTIFFDNLKKKYSNENGEVTINEILNITKSSEFLEEMGSNLQETLQLGI